MPAPEELKQKITLLANGPGTAIVDQMQATITSVQDMVQSFPTYAKNLESLVFETTTSIRQTIAVADKFALPLNLLTDAINKIKARPMVRRYHELEEQLNNPMTQTVILAAIRREIQQIKSSVSPELSKLVSKSQQALTHRLNLLQCWKSVDKLEIRVLEELLNVCLARILSEAESSGEEELARVLQEKIQFLKQQTEVKMTRIEKSMLQIGNIKYLKDTLTHQLIEVVRIEDTIQEKYQTLHTLSEITADLESGLPKEKLTSLIQPSKHKDSTSVPNDHATNRMAYKR